MNAKQRMLVTCMAIGLGVSSVHAEEAHHPGADSESGTAEAAQSLQPPAPADSAGTGMNMMGQGMAGNQGGMGMMGGMQKNDRGQDAMGMGRGGMMGMMHSGKGSGMGMMHGGQGNAGMMGHAMGGGHQMMMDKHQEVVSQLNLIEARLAKIEVLLERINQR